MSKKFLDAVNDFKVLSNDATTGNDVFGRSLMNLGIKKIIAMNDWSFNKGSRTLSSGTNQQYYELPYNAEKVDYINIYSGGVWYAPKEIRDGERWRIINNVNVYSDVPSNWYVSNRTKKIGIYPIPSSATVRIKQGFTKKLIDFGVSDYSTGTVTLTTDSDSISISGGTFTSSMIGRSLQFENYWYEISDASSGTIVVNQVPTSTSSGSFVISELIPFPNGFEDIPIWWALDKYYLNNEAPNISKEYENMWKEGVDEMLRRDERSVQKVLENESKITQLDPNENPWAIELE